MNRLAGLASITVISVMLYTGFNAATGSAHVHQRQASYGARLACAENPQCNGPVEGEK